MIRRAAVPIILALLATAGCGTTAPGPSADAALPLPLGGAGYPTAGEQARLHTSEEALVAACMHAHGFDYRPVPAADRPTPNPYGLLTEKDAREDGYGMTSAALAELSLPDPNQAAVAALPAERRDAWDSALLGTGHSQTTVSATGAADLQVNTDSCVYEARTKLYGPGYDQLDLRVEGLDGTVVGAVSKDPDILGVQQKWSACMTRHGHPAATLQAARTRVEDELTQAGNRSDALHATARDELDLAQTDATCQKSVKFDDVVRDAQTRAEAALGAPAHDTAAELVAARHLALLRSTSD